MRISIFGLGYVGTVSAACLAERGHAVIGVDINPSKVERLRSGRAPIVEKDIDELIRKGLANGNLTALTSTREAIADSDVSIVCVGTPSAPNGSLDTRAISKVSHEIGEALADKPNHHTIVVRSTVLPGTFRNLIIPKLESASGRKAGDGFSVAANPEFLREGTAVADFNNPAKTVIGADEEKTADIVASLYDGIPGALIRTSPEVAEVIKYVDNPWHALKVVFANEVGNICQAVGVDSRTVMEIFVQDTKLNLSGAYLRPGFAYGGSCLPKDLRAICYFGQQLDLRLPVMQAIGQSNAEQIARAVDWVLSFGKRDIAVLGCSFKAGTDDLRESPYITMIEGLIGKGCRLRIFDYNVNLSKLIGANRDFLYAAIPHISSLMVETAAEAVEEASLVLLTVAAPEYTAVLTELTDEQELLDFANIGAAAAQLGQRYHGLNW